MSTVLIKRYANRKLYNTESSRYITLKGIAELIHEGREIQVIDNESGEDISSIVMSQILVDDQKQHRADDSAVPGHVLSELIQRGGDALYNALRRGMDDAQGNITEVRANVRKFLDRGGQREIELPDIANAVHQSVERGLKVIDLPTRSDMEALNKNLERLATALESFELRIQALERRD